MAMFPLLYDFKRCCRTGCSDLSYGDGSNQIAQWRTAGGPTKIEHSPAEGVGDTACGIVLDGIFVELASTSEETLARVLEAAGRGPAVPHGAENSSADPGRGRRVEAPAADHAPANGVDLSEGQVRGVTRGLGCHRVLVSVRR